MNQEPDQLEERRWVSNAQLQLELRAMADRFEKRISDMKLWIFGAVALNQFLGAVDIPPKVTGAAFAGLVAKGLIGALLRGGG